jgi:hypothetical protein
VVGIGFKGSVSKDKIKGFEEKVKYWKRCSRRPPKDLWKTFAKWVTHPENLYRRLKKSGSQRNLP